MLFRQVREVEVTGERAGDLLRPFQSPRRDQSLGVALEAVVIASANDKSAQSLDVAQEIGAARFGDDGA
jgi:hypothetical protein